MALWSENVSVELTSPRHREGFPSGSAVKNLPAMQKTWETQVRSLGREDPLEKENGNLVQYSCLEHPMDREAGGL